MSKEFAKSCRRLEERGGQLLGLSLLAVGRFFWSKKEKLGLQARGGKLLQGRARSSKLERLELEKEEGRAQRKTREKLKENRGKKRSILSALRIVAQVRIHSISDFFLYACLDSHMCIITLSIR